MIPHDSRIDTAVKNSHVLATRCDIHNSVRSIYSDLQITDGNVTIDATSKTRRTANITLTDPTGALSVRAAEDLLAPYGNRFRLYRGVEIAGVKVMVSLGVFYMYNYKINDGGDALYIQVAGKDLSYVVDRNKFPRPWFVPSGTSSYGIQAQNILDWAFPYIQYNTNLALLLPTQVLPAIMFDANSSPWEAVTKLLNDSGYDIYFNTDGLLTATPLQNVGRGQVSWTYAEGAEAMMLSVDKELDTENTFNHFIVTGEPTDGVTTVWAETKDDLIGSPTYYLGQYGDVVSTYTSNLIIDAPQALRVANAMFATRGGATESVHFNSIPHPAHDVYDIIQVTRNISGIDARYMIQSMTIPMVAERACEFTCFNRSLQLP